MLFRSSNCAVLPYPRFSVFIVYRDFMRLASEILFFTYLHTVAYRAKNMVARAKARWSHALRFFCDHFRQKCNFFVKLCAIWFLTPDGLVQNGTERPRFSAGVNLRLIAIPYISTIAKKNPERLHCILSYLCPVIRISGL